MALKKEKKVELINLYENALKNSKSAVYVSFKGLPVSKQEGLRKKLFAEQMNYTVVKKSLWDRATSASKIRGEAPAVTAEMAVLWGNDLLAPARIANDFVKLNKKKMAILGGIFDGAFRDANGMLEIANIPPREVLLSQLAYLLKSPMQRIAIAVSEVAKNKN
jgi:large subunit ribosomal protein L10